MKKGILTTLMLGAVALIASAQTTIDMGGVSATLTVKETQNAGQGVVYKKIEVNKGGYKVRTIHLLDVDLTNPNVSVEILLAKDKYRSTETLSAMYNRLNKPGYTMVAGMNCTPYIMSVHETQLPAYFGGLAGEPAYAICSNGWPVCGHTEYDRGFDDVDDRYESGYLAIDQNKKAYINDFYFTGSVQSSNVSINLNHLNRKHNADPFNHTTLYNKTVGTTPQRSCAEVVFTTNDEWVANGSLTCTVTSKNTTGGTTLSGKQGALQGVNGDVALVNQLNVGDVFTLNINLTARDGSFPSTSRIEQLCGGYSLNMKGGVLSNRNTDEAYNSGDYPRPMMGTNAAGNHLWLIEMQTPGMSTAEGCYILKSMGAVDAAAFDGGGSAEMNVKGSMVLLSSDGASRAQPVQLWVINKVNDQEKPVISNVQVSNISSRGYTVRCEATDDSGIAKLSFPTWSVANGQDDIKWYEVTTPVSGNTYECQIKVANHNNEHGDFITHIYAYDLAGKSSTVAVPTVTVPEPAAGDCNQYGWESSEDMYQALAADVIAAKAGGLNFGFCSEFGAGLRETFGTPDISGNEGVAFDIQTFDMAFFTTAPYAAKWGWLKEYINNRCDADSKTKPEDAETYASAFMRYNLAAFFGNTQRTEWPATPNYASYGSNSTAYYATWGSELCNGGTTAIEHKPYTIKANAQKVMIDGQLYIIRDNRVYNVMGKEL